MAFHLGSLFVDLNWRADNRQADVFGRKVDELRAKTVNDISQKVGFETDTKAADAFGAKVDAIRIKSTKDIVQKVRIDYDSGPIRRFEADGIRLGGVLTKLGDIIGPIQPSGGGGTGISTRIFGLGGSIERMGPLALALVPIITSLAGSLTALAGSLGAAAAGAGALATGLGASFTGALPVIGRVIDRLSKVKDAYDAQTKVAKDNTKANRDALRDATKDLSANEQKLLAVFGRITEAYDKALGPAGDKVFGGLIKGIDALLPKLGQMTRPFTELGSAIGNSLARIGKALAGEQWTQSFKSFVDNATALMKPFTDIFIHLTGLIRDIALAALPLVTKAFKAVAGAIKGLDDRATLPEITKVVRDLVKHTKSWWDLIVAVGRLLFTVFSRSSRQGKSLVDQITDLVNKWNKWLQTDEGQKKLQEFLKVSIEFTKDLAAVMGGLIRAFVYLGYAISKVNEFLQDADKFFGKLDHAVSEFVKSVISHAADQFLGFITTVLGAFEGLVKVAGHIPGVGGKFKDLANSIQDARDNIDKYRESLRKTKEHGDKFDLKAVKKETKETGMAFKHLSEDGDSSMKNIDDVVQRRSRAIKKNLGDNSAEGKRALADNFNKARKAVVKQMGGASHVTKQGMEQIRGYLSQELQLYGFTVKEARIAMRGKNAAGQLPVDFGPAAGSSFGTQSPDNQRGGFVERHQSGGWLGGSKNVVGPDTIKIGPNAFAAPGEFFAKGPFGTGAVINRHQTPIVDMMLQMGGYSLDTLPRDNRALPLIEMAMMPMGGLANLFATINRPHMFAGGGLLGAISAANQLERAHFPYLWGGGHQASPAPFGPMDCSGAVSYVLQHAGVGIPTMTSGQLAGAGAAGPGPLTVFANAGHTLMRIGSRFFGTSNTNPGGGAGWIDPPPDPSYLSNFSVRHFISGMGLGTSTIPTPRVRGGGAVGRVAQRALQLGANAANSLVSRAVSTMGLGTGDPGQGGSEGSWSKSMLMQLWERAGGPPGIANLMAAIALAESGGRPGIVNSIGAGGLWQIYPPERNYLDPWTNAHIAIRKLSEQGLGAWVAYTNGSYRQFLQGGGYTHGNINVGGDGLATDPGNINFGVGDTAMAPGSLNFLKHRVRRHRGQFGKYEDQIARLQTDYEYWDRRYGLSEETLIDENTGEINQGQIRKRARELGKLIEIRQHIVRVINQAIQKARQVVRNYGTIIKRLDNRHLTKRNREGIKNQLKAYRGALKDWNQTIADLTNDRRFAKLDVREISSELADVLGTKAQPVEGETPGVTPDQQALIDQASQAAYVKGRTEFLDAAANQVFTQSGSVGNIGYAQAVPGQPIDMSHGRGDVVIIQNNLHPGDSRTLDAIGRAATAGQAMQPAVSSPRTFLGV